MARQQLCWAQLKYLVSVLIPMLRYKFDMDNASMQGHGLVDF